MVKANTARHGASLPPIIQSLLDASRYPHPVPDGVKLVETHGAWVLLAGEFAYKIKKPVKLSFMDFSTLDKRQEDCARELAINRRLGQSNGADQLYLGVMPLVGEATAPRWGQAGTVPDDAIEYALKMKRFDESLQLDAVCQRGELTAEVVMQLARDVARFQSEAPVAHPDQSPWGQPDGLLRWARENFASLSADIPADSPLRPILQALEVWTEFHFRAIQPLLMKRLVDGCVREGHGDLHLGNLVLLDGRALPFDAIEFNDELRWIDTASEVAFLWMDLMHRQRFGLAHVWLSEWLDASGDIDAIGVLPFFAVYRALVRAKVAAIQLKQAQGDPARERTVLVECMSYIGLASLLTSRGEPVLAITHGLSGCGKSTAALHFLQAQITTPRCLRLRSDVERKRLYGLQANARSGSGINQGLYAPQAHHATYESLARRTRDLLANGWSVVVDAAFLRHAERDEFRQLALWQGCRFFILAPTASLDTLKSRIVARTTAGSDASEATVAVLEQQLEWVEPLTPSEESCLLPPRRGH